MSPSVVEGWFWNFVAQIWRLSRTWWIGDRRTYRGQPQPTTNGTKGADSPPKHINAHGTVESPLISVLRVNDSLAGFRRRIEDEKGHWGFFEFGCHGWCLM